MPGSTSNHPITNLPQFSMPVAHATLKRCLCEECIEKGRYDKKGTPTGVLMAEHLIVSHILCVKVECTADNTSSVAIIADDLRRLTLDTDVPVNISLSSTVCTVELKPDTKAIKSQLDILATQCSSHEPSDDTPIKINTDTLLQDPVNELDEITQIVLFLGIACRVIIGVSRSSYDLIMKIISVILFLAFWRPDNSLNSSHTNILKQIPMTSESTEARFHLKGKIVLYACTHCPMLMTECGEALLVGADGNFRPRRTFMYHDFKDYLFGLLSHRDIEAVMDQACNNLMDSINSPHLSFIKTPFEAQFLRQFNGPQPGSLFVDRGEEGHYVFALHVDFFNLEGLNIRSASTSCGIISMACLNLPVDIRYKPENICMAAQY
ncbi:hypothetical protein BDR06DRAFT_1064675 [Suillus hirtellus]|nr:hypothetical protein BDR06DRAFT_1064675 [Suillus hirtellus]